MGELQQTGRDALRECPFCGGEAFSNNVPKNCWIMCRECQANVKTCDTPAEAIAAWNTRAAQEARWASEGDVL